MTSSPASPVLGCIADDFTGGTDVGNTLAREGLAVVQTVGLPAADLVLPPADAVVVALRSRTAPVAAAVADSVAALRWLRDRGARRFYFKYCSTFDSRDDGNIGPVADALLDELDAPFTVACPAFPETGRTVYQGHLFVGDRLLEESAMAHHPLTPMTDSDLVRLLARQTRRPVGLVPLQTVVRGRDAVRAALRDLVEAGVGHAVVDAIGDSDLREIGWAIADLPVATGASGLARGLPAAFRERDLLGGAAAGEPIELPEGPAAIVAGSASRATRDQVARFAHTGAAFAVDPRTIAGDAGRLDEIVAAAADALRRGPVVVHAANDDDAVAAAQRELGVARSAALVEGALAAAARALVDAGARRLVVAGGETSGAVVEALGLRALRIGPEIEPGVPWCLSVDEPHLAVAMKSGNFGSPDFFARALGWPR